MKYPIGIQTFESVICSGCVYIDKTAQIYELTHSSKYVFLSRPRRFGKSLLLSTVKAYFQGRRDLFKGLAIEDLEREWTEHPVMHLDLNLGLYTSVDGLREALNDQLIYFESVYGRHPASDEPALRFRWVIERASAEAGRGVVILVDEYDKPLLETIGDAQLQSAYRAMLKPFYGVLKTCDSHIRFAMLTGVTKYGHLSVFSDLNNIRDISMLPRYASICGITDSEIRHSLLPGIRDMAAAMDIDEAAVLDRLRQKYDGYRFTKADVKVFNPYSLLNALEDQEMSDYWFQTGTPSYLVHLIRLGRLRVASIENTAVDESMLSSVDPQNNNPVTILYQSGYLTITGYDSASSLYTLGIPTRRFAVASSGIFCPDKAAPPHRLRRRPKKLF